MYSLMQVHASLDVLYVPRWENIELSIESQIDIRAIRSFFFYAWISNWFEDIVTFASKIGDGAISFLETNFHISFNSNFICNFCFYKMYQVPLNFGHSLVVRQLEAMLLREGLLVPQFLYTSLSLVSFLIFLFLLSLY